MKIPYIPLPSLSDGLNRRVPTCLTLATVTMNVVDEFGLMSQCTYGVVAEKKQSLQFGEETTNENAWMR